MKKILSVLILLFFTIISCTTKYKNMQSFETVWQTINDKYFDPNFGGLDWSEVHDRYQPQIAAAQNEGEYYLLINKMLLELNVSHVGVVPPDDLSQLSPILAAEGSIGIDVRMLDNDAVITSVKSDYPGAQARLRPGYVIKGIDGIKIEQIVDLKHINDIEYQNIDKETYKNLKLLAPPYNERNRNKQITNAVRKKIYGLPDSIVSIEYMDENGDTQKEKIVRAKRKDKIVFDDAMPPFFVEFEAKRLDNNIGYIRFNAFMPTVDHKFKSTIDSMQDTSALIIDIRGNHGGVFDVRKAIAEALVKDRVLCWRYKARDKTRDIFLEPTTNGYDRPVAVIVDYMCASSCEELSGGLQAIKRATIIGDRTPGIVSPAHFFKLPNGATFLYPYTQSITADGTVLEGHGVVPDIEMALDRNELLQGKDTQLEAAIYFILKNR